MSVVCPRHEGEFQRFSTPCYQAASLMHVGPRVRRRTRLRVLPIPQGQSQNRSPLTAEARCQQANLDVTWLRKESLQDLGNLPSPDVRGMAVSDRSIASLWA